MSVIIRLQNLPWTANARDIRNFFAGLSIPEGGVHIIGGEMGDAFIAFSTDEDARKAMLKDREKLMEVQVRLLLSSRAEMQKVIETARQQSVAPAVATTLAAPIVVASQPVAASINIPATIPNPPIISASGLQNFLTQANLDKPPSFLAYQQQAGISLSDTTSGAGGMTGFGQKINSYGKQKKDSPVRRRSSSRERRRSRSRSRDRTSSRRSRRSRSRSRDRDWHSSRGDRRSSRRGSSRDRGTDSDRDRSSRESSRERIRNNRERGRNENKPKAPVVSLWDMPQKSKLLPHNGSNLPIGNPSGVNPPTPFSTVSNVSQNLSGIGLKSGTQETGTVLPVFQSFHSTTTTSTTNNYSINLPVAGGNNVSAGSSSNDASIKPPKIQNPYLAALQSINSNSNSSDSIPGLGLGITNQQPQQSPLSIFQSLLKDQISDVKPVAPAQLPPSQQATIPLNIQSTMLNPPTMLNPSSTTSMFNTHLASQIIPTPTPQLAMQPIVQQQQQQTQQLPLSQEPIAFASVNPYAQIYPQLFEQAAARTGQQQIQPALQLQQRSTLPSKASPPHRSGSGSPRILSNMDTCYVKVSNMCNSTTYSDLRKFFTGLYIPHNGIKIINDNQGQRVGVAYIEFSRVSSAQKAIARNNTHFKGKLIKIETVIHTEFEKAEDSYRPGRSDIDSQLRNRSSSSPTGMNNAADAMLPFNVIVLEELPNNTTEQDVMKMFSSFTIVDILMVSSPNNRRELVAHVQFSREDEAQTALEDNSRHMIGYRKIRKRPGSLTEMQNTKEKIRLANEQLIKEEEMAMHDIGTTGENPIVIDDGESDDGDIGKGSSGGIQNDNKNQGSNNGQMFNADPRRRAQQNQKQSQQQQQQSQQQLNQQQSQQQHQQQQQHPNMQQRNYNNNNNGNYNNGNNYNDGSRFNDPQCFMPPNLNNMNMMDMNRSFQMNNMNMNMNMDSQQQKSDEDKYVIVKNCEYSARINDMGEWLSSFNYRMNHIEMLFNERNLPAGEFIVEFIDSHNAAGAIREMHNRRFRGRSIRFIHITPQEIANRLGKPFLNYVPGGNGKISSRNNDMGMGGGGGSNAGGDMCNINANSNEIVQAALELINGIVQPNMGNSNGGGGGNNMLSNQTRFGGPNDNRNQQQQQQQQGGSMFNDNGNDNGSDNLKQQHRNPFAVERQTQASIDNDTFNKPNADLLNAGNNNDGSVSGDGGKSSGGLGDDGIPDKFNRPGCVIAMRNVPFKANLKDILRFFNDYELNPEDIIRRFNDDGTPTGDARVAFETPTQARTAYESRRRRQIYNRKVYLSILNDIIISSYDPPN